MNTPVRLAVVAAGLGAVFAAAVGIGAAVGPIGAPEPHPGTTASPAAPAAAEAVAGLAVAESGYVLDVLDPQPPAGTATLAFRVLGADGAPVPADTVSEMHLVAVRRDLSGYQHVHAVVDGEGTWRAPLTLTPGSWRVIADTTPTALGEDLTLGADVEVAGDYTPVALPEPSAVADVDGYTVVLTGDLAAGAESELTFSVSRDGRPVTDLQRYLGTYGHLVALRDGDLGYLHVHPVEPENGTTQAPGPHVGFATTAPSAGTYRLFLDFWHGDAVHTAAFTVRVGPDGEATAEPAPHGHGD
ncbi:hypothetical protein ACI782_07520 [Geodermatophilus sp. SYSU D00703]